MAASEITEALLALEDAPAARKVSGYNALLEQITATSPPDTLAANLTAYIDSIIGDDVGIVTSRPLLAAFVSKFATIPAPDTKIEAGTHAISAIAPKVVSYEEQDTALKLIVADAHEANEDYTSSAKILQQITLDSSQRAVTDDDKASIWIRITRCYLEEEDPTAALTYLNRVKNVIHAVTSHTLKLQFALSQARISDSQRQFLDASRSYLAISNEPIIDADDRQHALSAAITCAVLAPAGPKRARQLASLYKDERAQDCDEFAILEKIFLDRVLAPAEVKAFGARLKPHQMALTGDGTTVLDRAVLEHNLRGVSRLYSNIAVADLGDMLGVSADSAEAYASSMIEQGRLAGYIDQIDGLIYFEGESHAEGTAKPAASLGTLAVGAAELRAWDANVQALAEEVERVTTLLQAEAPEFYALHMVH